MIDYSRLLLMLLLPVSLAGCVVFERPPAPLSCDPRLEGRWIPVANTVEEGKQLTAEDYALVDAECRATVSMSQIGVNPASKVEIEVQGFALGQEHYFALSEESVAKLFSKGEKVRASLAKLPSSAVTLVRYRIQDDQLTLATVDGDTVKKMIDSRRLPARALDEFNYLIAGDEAALREVLLANPDLFENKTAPPMKMRRATGSPP